MKTPSFSLAVVTLALALPAAVRAASCCSAPAKPETIPAASAGAPLTAKSLYQLDARWTDDTGREQTLAELRGEPVVFTMMFTHCAYACPMLVQDLRKVRAQLPPAARERVRFVLVTFDTVRDTTARLREYREAQQFDARWTLLRGSAADTQTLAMLLGVQFKREATGQFAHSNLITLLNTDGEIVHQRTGLTGGLEGLAEAIVRVAVKS
jgi:protein SCO1/2